MDIAKALIGDRRIEIKVTGIRPGEKIHEILVSEEEANRCVERGKYYAILSMLPELHEEDSPEINALTKEFSSGDVVLDLRAVHGLVPERAVETAQDAFLYVNRLKNEMGLAAVREARKLADELMEKGAGQWEELEKMLRAAFRKGLDTLDIAQNEAFQKL